MMSFALRYGALLGLTVAVATSTFAAPPRSIYFWSSAVGTEGLKAGVDSARLGTWGNGTYTDARKVLYEGASTLKITTRNYREGIRFDLRQPLDIEPYRTSGYIRLRVKFREAAAAATPTAGVGAPGGATPGAAPGGFGGQGGFGGGATNGGFGGGGFGGMANPRYDANYQLGPLPPLGGMGGLPTGEGNEPIITGPPAQETTLSHLLCTMVLDRGVMEGSIDIPKQWENPGQIDFEKVHPDANGWLMFVLPVREMHSTPGASGAVRRMILSGDREDSFYLTQAALVVESGQMSVSIRRLSDAPGTQIGEITVRPGPLTLVAEVEAGAADPAIEWNFDADNVGNLPPPNPDGLPEGAQPAGGVTPDGAQQPAVGGWPVGTPATGGLPGMPKGGTTTPKQGTTGPMIGPAGAVPAEAPAVGPRIDARGLVAKFEYPDEEQNYRVEVTVRDRSGKKEPVTASLMVRVRS
jgi:hypothetical protein